jgi:hypothetical protein
MTYIMCIFYLNFCFQKIKMKLLRNQITAFVLILSVVASHIMHIYLSNEY